MRSYRWLARWQSGSRHSGGATSRHVRAAAALQPSNSTAPTESGRVSGGSVSPRSSSMASSRASCCSSVASHGSPFPPWGVHLPESAPLLHEPPRLSVARLFPGRGSSATTFPRKRPRSGSQPDHGSRLRRHFPSAVRPAALLPAPAGPAPRSSSSPPPSSSARASMPRSRRSSRPSGSSALPLPSSPPGLSLDSSSRSRAARAGRRAAGLERPPGIPCCELSSGSPAVERTVISLVRGVPGDPTPG